MNDLIFEFLDTSIHNRAAFDCGVVVLNQFLQTKANKEMKQKLNTTYVCTKKSCSLPKDILGYYTLSTSSLVLGAVPEGLAKHIPANYRIPTAKIGRLARDKNAIGIGSLLLQDALFRILKMSADIGIYGIEVDAKDANVKHFYEKFGFIPFLDNKYSLFIPLKTISSVFN